MALATGIGSMPGDDAAAYDEAVRLVLGELPDLPHLPELPGRGPTASMTGRALGVVTELAADLQPAGWRLTSSGTPGVDHRRARSLLSQDLDAMEEQGQELEGAFKIQITGPWTLAATVERPRGDRLLADPGARRELAQALAAGVADHVDDVRRRLPRVSRLVVQVDEPSLPAVLGGRVPTASGFGRHRSVHPPEVSEALGWLATAISDAGAEPWVHCCAADVPLRLLRDAGSRGLSIDASQLLEKDHDAVAELLDGGIVVALGLVPTTEPTDPEGITAGPLGESVIRFLDRVGLDPAEVGGSLVVTPQCGLAHASPTWVRQALGLARTTAAQLS